MRKRHKLLLAILAWSVAAPVLAELRVVRRAGPSAQQYRIGARLPDDHDFVLRRGDRVTVLTSRGTVTIIGPATGTLPSLIRRGQATVNTPQTGLGTIR